MAKSTFLNSKSSVISATILGEVLRGVEEQVSAMKEDVTTPTSWVGSVNKLPGELSKDIPSAVRMLKRRTGGLDPPRIGRFVVVSGIDKSGKETHCFNPRGRRDISSVTDHLSGRGYRVLKKALPSYNTSIGSLIATYLGKPTKFDLDGKLDADCAWVLWALDRAQHNADVENWIRANPRNVALSKRWTETNIAYQLPNGISSQRILSLECNLVKPDLTIVIDVPPEASMKRIAFGEALDRYENLEYLRKVREIYLRLPDYYPFGEVISIDGSKSLLETNRAILSAVDRDSWFKDAENPVRSPGRSS